MSDIDGQESLMPDDDTPATDKAPKAAKATRAPAAKKAAPKRTRKPRATTTPRGGRPNKDAFKSICAATVDQVIGLATIGGITSPRIAYDAQVLELHRDDLATELFERGWDAKAGTTNRFGKWLENAGTLGEWGRTLTLVVGIGLPIAANHGVLPAETVAIVNLARREPLPVPEPRSKADVDDLEPETDARGWPVPTTEPAPVTEPITFGPRPA